MTSWAERQRDARLERDYERGIANRVPCPEPGCEASAGETCRNLRTGEPLEHQAAHDKRIKAASEVAS
jgi:hypothetical protein